MKIKEGQQVEIHQSGRPKYRAKAYVSFDGMKDDEFQLQLDQDKPLNLGGSVYQRGDCFTIKRGSCLLVPVEAKR